MGRRLDPSIEGKRCSITFYTDEDLRDWLDAEADADPIARGSRAHVIREIIEAEKARREKRAQTEEGE